MLTHCTRKSFCQDRAKLDCDSCKLRCTPPTRGLHGSSISCSKYLSLCDQFAIFQISLLPVFTLCPHPWQSRSRLLKEDLISYVWHLKHAVEQTFMAPLGIRSLFAFCPSHLPVVAASSVDPVEGNVRAAHCCHNAAHLYALGVNRYESFCLGFSAHISFIQTAVPASLSVSAQSKKGPKRCLFSSPRDGADWSRQL